MKRQEEEEAIESEGATQLALYGNCKQKQNLEKCNVNQNKQIVSRQQDNVWILILYELSETETDPLKKLEIEVKHSLKVKSKKYIVSSDLKVSAEPACLRSAGRLFQRKEAWWEKALQLTSS